MSKPEHHYIVFERINLRKSQIFFTYILLLQLSVLKNGEHYTLISHSVDFFLFYLYIFCSSFEVNRYLKRD